MNLRHPPSLKDALAACALEAQRQEVARQQGEPAPAPAVQPKRKYRNKPTEVDGILFDSMKEAARYVVLRSKERMREIEGLHLQVKYPLAVEGVPICSYVADFVYREHGVLVVEDVKGMRTREYKLKAKLMLAIHGIKVREV